MKNWTLPATALAAAALSVGCGGSPQVDEGVPTDTTANFTQFVGTRAADEQAEPLAVDMVLPPTSETDEPLVLG
jgi:hypothetical protein